MVILSLEYLPKKKEPQIHLSLEDINSLSASSPKEVFEPSASRRRMVAENEPPPFWVAHGPGVLLIRMKCCLAPLLANTGKISVLLILCLVFDFSERCMRPLGNKPIC